MPRGVPKNGFRMTARRVALMQQGVAIEELTKPSFNVTPAVLPIAEPITKETDEEIREKIDLRFSLLHKMILAAAKGDIPALIVSGPPGLGKTFETDRALMEAFDGDEDAFVSVHGSVSSIGLFELLWENREPGKVIVFDDADKVFEGEESLNLLKAATDSTDVRKVSWAKASSFLEDKEIDRHFVFEGSIIFLTNLDLSKMASDGGRMAPHFEALISRSHYLDLAMKTKRDYIVRIADVIRESDMMEKKGLTSEDGEIILDFIVDNMDSLRELSLRVVAKLANLMKIDPNGWMEIAKVTMMKS